MTPKTLKLVIEVDTQTYLNTTGINLTKKSLEDWSDNLARALCGEWSKDLSVYGVSIAVMEGGEQGKGAPPSQEGQEGK